MEEPTPIPRKQPRLYRWPWYTRIVFTIFLVHLVLIYWLIEYARTMKLR